MNNANSVLQQDTEDVDHHPGTEESLGQLAERLILSIRSLGSCVIAFSGGVDSAVVTKAAYLALGDKAVAITGVGPSLSAEEQAIASQVAQHIGIRHVFIKTDEIENPSYVENSGRRCYFCKSELYDKLGAWAAANHCRTILSGTNTDDLGDYRPGLQAAAEQSVVAPLVECGIDKETVRRLSRFWELAVSEKPATPCLASRVAYGESITEDKLARVGAAERFLNTYGFGDVRVRFHAGDLARIELHAADLERVLNTEVRAEINRELCRLGFRFVTLDLAGRQPGSLNRMLPLVQISP